MANQDTSQYVTGTCSKKRQANKTQPAYTETIVVNPAETYELKIVGTAPRIKPKGWLFPTSYDRRHVTMRNPKGFSISESTDATGWKMTNSGPLDKADGIMQNSDMRQTSADGIARVTVDMLSQAESKALNRFLTHGNDREGTWRPGIAWGERAETAQLLTLSAKRVVGLISALKRGDWKRANQYLPVGTRKRWRELKNTPYGKWLTANQRRAIRQSPKALASGILEYQNGWKPLLGDVHNAAEALANRNTQADWVITGIGKYNRFEQDTVRYDTSTIYVKHPREQVDFILTRGVKVRLDATVEDQHLHRLAQLGLNNPIADVWELLPLSYIVDYFVGVGTWLQSLGAASGMKFYSGSYTMYYNLVATNTSWDESRGVWHGSKRWMEMRRRPYTGFPFPIAPLSLKPEKLSLAQFANMASVLTMLLSGQSVPYSRMG